MVIYHYPHQFLYGMSHTLTVIGIIAESMLKLINNTRMVMILNITIVMSCDYLMVMPAPCFSSLKLENWLKKKTCYSYYYRKEENNEHFNFYLCICWMRNSKFDFIGYLLCTTLKITASMNRTSGGDLSYGIAAV